MDTQAVRQLVKWSLIQKLKLTQTRNSSIFLFALFSFLGTGCGYMQGLLSTRVMVPTSGSSSIQVSRVSPSQVLMTGGQTISIYGFGFAEGDTVTLSGSSCSSVTYVSSNELQCVTPAQANIGTLDVKVDRVGALPGIKTLAAKNYIVMGQPDATTNLQLRNGLYAPYAVATCGGKLFAADTFNSRVLVWNSIPVSSATPPDVVLGQTDFSTRDANLSGSTTASTLSQPKGVACDSSHLFVSDSDNNRVLIWNSLTLASGQAADVAVGQVDLLGSTAGTSPATMSSPQEVTVGPDGNLYVVDNGNSRVLIYAGIPASSGASAVLVLGQPDFVSSNSNYAADGLSSPVGITFVGNQLAVSDDGNRILIWNAPPVSNGQPADAVIGQSSFTSNGSSCAADGLFGPMQLATDGSKLFVADGSNNRILIYSTLPTTNPASTSASVVIGQSNLSVCTANASGVNAESLQNAYGVTVTSTGKVIASELSNNRIQIWNSIPLLNHASADTVLGQVDSTLSTLNSGSILPSYLTLLNPKDVAFDGASRLAIADSGHSRILIYNRLPTSPTQTPDIVLGQGTATGVACAAPTSRTICDIQGLSWAGNALIASDNGRNRVMIWNTVTTNNQAADVILGQSTTTGSMANQPSFSATSQNLSGPAGVRYAGGRLYVADSGNNRVLYWNSLPSALDQAADGVLGQASLTANSPNRGTSVSAASMNIPSAIDSDGTHLAVTDSSNLRVLVWNSIPSGNGAAADTVLGRSSPTSNLPTGIAQSTTVDPIGLAFNDGSLFVADARYSHIINWSLANLTNAALASGIWGQADYSNLIPNSNGIGLTSLSRAMSLQFYSNGEIIADTGNNRVIIMSTAVVN